MNSTNPWDSIVGSCYTSESLARVLGWTEAEVVTAAARLTVLELLTVERVRLYPTFQVHEGRMVGGLNAVLQVMSNGTQSRWTWAQWLNTRVDDDSGEEGPSAIEQLREGHLGDVLHSARHVAWTWST